MFDRSAEYKNLILCVTSLLFVIWGKAFAAAAIFLSVIVDFVLAIAAEGSLKRSKQSAAVFMVIDFLFNAGLFVWLTHNELFTSDSALHLRSALIPVGVGFYTLKNFSYVYDVYSGRIKAERNIFCLLTYGMSYPFLLAGPVVRYGDVEPQIRKRGTDLSKISSGLSSFALGFAKVTLAVPVLTKLANAGLDPKEPTLIGAWAGMIAFFGAAYFSFAGLSDMGAGCARMNGFDCEVNYRPITAKHMVGGLVNSYNTSMAGFFPRHLRQGRRGVSADGGLRAYRRGILRAEQVRYGNGRSHRAAAYDRKSAELRSDREDTHGAESARAVRYRYAYLLGFRIRQLWRMEELAGLPDGQGHALPTEQGCKVHHNKQLLAAADSADKRNAHRQGA